MAEVTTETVHILQGEIRILNARVQDSDGGLTLTSATYQLLQQDGVTPIGAVIPATIAVAGPAVEVKATQSFDTTSLIKGNYTAKFILNTNIGVETIYIPLIVGLYSDPPQIGLGGATLFTGLELPDSGSLVGNTLVLRRSETGNGIFPVPSANVVLVSPDGTTSTPTTATVYPSSPSNSYVLQVLFNEALAGDYEAKWTITANGQTLLRRETHYAFWTDVRSQVRRLLRVNSTAINDNDVDLAARSVLASVLSLDEFGRYISGYSSVPMADRTVFDQALALMIASWMRPFTPKQGAIGELIGLAIGPDEYRWSPTSRPQDTVSVEESWLNTALDLLSSLTSLSGAFGWQDAQVGFVAAGHRRTVISHMSSCLYGAYCNPLISAWGSWLDCGAAFSWSWGNCK